MIKYLKFTLLSICLVISALLCSVRAFAENSNTLQEDNPYKNEIIIKYKDTNKENVVKSSLAKKLSVSKVNVKKELKSINAEVIDLGAVQNFDKIIDELKKNPNVEYVQPNYKLKSLSIPEDTYFSEQWGLSNSGQIINGYAGSSGIDINILPLWDVTKGSSNITVAVIDTGIDINHSELIFSIYINSAEIPGDGLDNDNNGYIDDVNGWDFAHSDASVYDFGPEDKHGTHVAGIIAARANNSGVRGVAPSIRILPLKFIIGDEGGYTSDAIEAIEYAYQQGARIVNCSFGGENYNQALCDAMKKSDMLFVCAAGNDGMNNDYFPTYPASFSLSNILSVASIDNQGYLSDFSNYGASVDIAAPGTDILSTLPCSGFGYMSGSSMAAPFVSGVAALIKSGFPDMSPEKIISRIYNSTTELRSLDGKVFTGGLIDAYSAYYGLSGKIGVPQNPQVQLSGDEATIRWSPVEGATSYELEINGNMLINVGTDTLYLQKDLSPNAQYYYKVRAKSSNEAGKWSKTIILETQPYASLNFTPTDCLKDPTKPILYMVDQNNQKLYSLNYETKEVKEIYFPLRPERLAFYNNEIYVTLLTRQHSYYWWDEDQTGQIAIINADNFELTETFNIRLDPYDIAVKGDFIYVSSGSGQVTLIHSYSRQTKEFISKSLIYQRCNIEIHSVFDRIYTVDYYLGAYNVENGAFIEPRYYTKSTNYPRGEYFKISPDGKYILTTAGTIFSCSKDRSLDMSYVTDINSVFKDITFNIENNKFYTAVSNRKVNAYNYDSFALTNTYSTFGEINYLFYANQELVLLTQDSQGNNLIEKIDLKPVTLTTLNPSKVSPQTEGETVTFRASSTGKNEKFYQFWINDGTGWVVGQPYSLSCTYYWTPSKAGNYQIGVWVKDKFSISQYDDVKIIDYEIKPVPPIILSCDKVSPQMPGTTITITAKAAGSSEKYYQFWIHNGTEWIIAQPYSTTNTYSWTPSIAGNYKLGVWVKDKNSVNQYDKDSIIDYTIGNLEPVAITGFTTDKVSPQVPGTTITITATATGGSEKYYQFWIHNGTEWIIAQPYSTSNTCSWTPSNAGNYKLGVWVKDKNSANQYDKDSIIDYTIGNLEPVVITGLTTDKVSPQVPGTTITITATATGGSEKYYQFWIHNGTEWIIAQPYSTSNTCSWTPSNVGNYKLGVWVKDKNSANQYDKDSIIEYTIGNPEPVAITGLTTDKVSPQVSGTTITITATATGGSEKYYQFWIHNGTEWIIAQPYSTSNTCSWTPSNAGNYKLGVWVKDKNSVNQYDKDSIIEYTIGNPEPVAITGLTTDKVSPQVSGTTITITATATGGSEKYYQFWIHNGTEWVIAQPYSTSNTCSWTPSNAGNYKLGVWVKDKNSANQYDVDGIVQYEVQ